MAPSLHDPLDNAKLRALPENRRAVSTQPRALYDFGCQLCTVTDAANGALSRFGAGLKGDFVRCTDEPLAPHAEQQCPLYCHRFSLALGREPGSPVFSSQ
jgi:hypothetical protein